MAASDETVPAGQRREGWPEARGLARGERAGQRQEGWPEARGLERAQCNIYHNHMQLVVMVRQIVLTSFPGYSSEISACLTDNECL